MEKIFGLVGGIQRFSTEDGPGIRTTVFLAGCPLCCRWCHNPELIEGAQFIMHTPSRCINCGACATVCPRGAVVPGGLIDRESCDGCGACTNVCYAQALRPVIRRLSLNEVMDIILRDVGYYRRTGGGLTISGGELLAQPAFSEALLDEAKQNGLDVALDTSGFGDGVLLLRLVQKADHILYDLKAMKEEVHQVYTGVSSRLIINNLRQLAATGLQHKIVIRLPLISGVNDGDDNINAAGQLMQELSLTTATLLPYHSLGLSKSRGIVREQRIFAPPSGERLEQVAQLLNGYGVIARVRD